MTKKRELKSTAPVSDLLPEIRSLIESSRYRVAATANLELVSLYWNIGRVITQDIQKHDKRAGYGSELIEGLAENLTHQYGRGFSATNLWDTRRFFESFVIPRTLSGEFGNKCGSSRSAGLPVPKNSPDTVWGICRSHRS